MESFDKIIKKYKAIKKKALGERSIYEKLLIEFVLRIIDFYKIYDIYEKTNHSDIFELLFSSGRRLSSETISKKIHISVKTLYRFKQQYMIFMSEVLQMGIFGDKFGQMLTDFSSKNNIK